MATGVYPLKSMIDIHGAYNLSMLVESMIVQYTHGIYRYGTSKKNWYYGCWPAKSAHIYSVHWVLMMMTEVWGTTMKLAIGTERENTTSDCVAFFMIWLLSTHSYSHSLRSRVRDTYIYYIYTEVMKCHSTKMFLSLDKRVHKE